MATTARATPVRPSRERMSPRSRARLWRPILATPSSEAGEDAEAADRDAGCLAVEERAAPQEEAGDAQAAVHKGPTGALEQLAAVSQAMTCADHYMGLLDFEKAADRLEEQLVALSDEACPHRGGDLHLDVLLKYGKVLSWDGDAESAIDAFTAADEVLAERPAGEPGV